MRGAHPVRRDNRDHDYFRTVRFSGLTTLPLDFSVDIGRTMPDQNADGLPMGCTGYTQADNRGDEDRVVYDPKFTYEKTCLMEGHPDNQGCQIRNSLKSGIVYGYARPGENDQDALKHRGGKYANIYDTGGLDYFDAARFAIFNESHGLSMGGPWFASWTGVHNPILPMFDLKAGYSWHNWSCKGWKTINGIPYLLVKSWQGRNVGENGWLYIDRHTFNALIDVPGSAIFIQHRYDPKDVQTIELSIMETLAVYLRRMLDALWLSRFTQNLALN